MAEKTGTPASTTNKNQTKAGEPGKREKPRRLGRGLSALLTPDPVRIDEPTPTAPPATAPPSDDTEQAASVGVLSVPIDSVSPSPFQPRRTFDEAALTGLAASITAQGVMQPILVRILGVGRYELIAGERRLRAARLAGLKQVPAIERSLDDRQAAEWALIENVQREDLNPVERAEACRVLAERFGLKQAEIAKRLGLERSSVSNLMRLLELEPEILELLRTGALGQGHGKALLGAAPGKSRVELATKAVEHGVSVRTLEREISGSTSRANPQGMSPGVPKDESPRIEVRDLEDRLSKYLGTKAQIRTGSNAQKGRILLDFYSLDHFDDIMRAIGYQTEIEGIG
ncbi:MAG: ParB/RepB/Spo0J family partition protein [Planctomycetota bacterium]